MGVAYNAITCVSELIALVLVLVFLTWQRTHVVVRCSLTPSTDGAHYLKCFFNLQLPRACLLKQTNCIGCNKQKSHIHNNYVNHVFFLSVGPILNILCMYVVAKYLCSAALSPLLYHSIFAPFFIFFISVFLLKCFIRLIIVIWI